MAFSATDLDRLGLRHGKSPQERAWLVVGGALAFPVSIGLGIFVAVALRSGVGLILGVAAAFCSLFALYQASGTGAVGAVVRAGTTVFATLVSAFAELWWGWLLLLVVASTDSCGNKVYKVRPAGVVVYLLLIIAAPTLAVYARCIHERRRGGRRP